MCWNMKFGLEIDYEYTYKLYAKLVFLNHKLQNF
jgi:hypothetical protein